MTSDDSITSRVSLELIPHVSLLIVNLELVSIIVFNSASSSQIKWVLGVSLSSLIGVGVDVGVVVVIFVCRCCG